MTGLDKIIEKINIASEEKCKKIIEKAEEEANVIKDQSAKADKDFNDKVVSEAKDKANDIINMAKSGSQLSENKILLNTKSEIINNIISEAIDELKNLPDKEYFSALEQLLKNNVQSGEADMLLSKKDLSRLDESFKKTANSLGVKISETPADFDGGFILSYGDIEINCTFDAIAESLKDELKDKVNSILF